MRVVIYSQVRLFSDSLADCLRTCEDVSVVQVCARADALAHEVASLPADLVLFDMTNERALCEARAVGESCPRARLLALAIAETPDDVIACADAGFAGYIPKEASLDELCSAMRQVMRGECACNPKITASLLRELRRRRAPATVEPAAEALTSRETQVLALAGRGLSNKEIAHSLCVSVATVKNHLHNVFAKLRVARRSEALARLRNEPWLAGST